MLMTTVEILGWVGVGLYVIAYYLVSVGRVSGRSKPYQYMNLIGAFGVAANAFYYGALPSAVVNVVWFLIAATTLLGVLRAADERDPAHPESQEGRTVNRFLFFAGSLLAVFGLGLGVLIVSPKPPEPLKQVRVNTGDWQPYIGIELQNQGPLAQLTRRIFRRAGYDAQLQFMAWKPALDAVAQGETLAGVPFIKSPDRQADLLYSDPIITFQYALFYRADGPVTEDKLRRWSAGEIERPGWRLGVVEGYQLWASLSDAAPVAKTYANIGAAFQALDRGEIDLLPESRLVGRYLLLDPELAVDRSRFRMSPIDAGLLTSSTQNLHIIAPKNPAGARLIQAVNNAIAQLKQEGVLSQVQARFDRAQPVQTPPQHIIFDRVAQAIDQDGRTWSLARGVRAVVLDWPAEFDPSDHPADRPAHANTNADHAPRCRVKIITGPLRGRILHVHPDAFSIIQPEEMR